MIIKVSKIYFKPIYFLVALSILTVSFDIVGVINIGGTTFRLTQFLMMPVIFLALVFIIKKKVSVSIPYINYLILWCAIQLIFIVNSPDLKNAIGYYCWLIFNVLIIIAFNVIFTYPGYYKWLLRVYMKSYVLIALVGILQFVLYALGINFYVQQSWTDKLVRVSGFSYEPSYYSTYLIMGLVMYGYIYMQKQQDIIEKKEGKRDFIVIFLAIFLSSSRMGWLISGLFIIFLGLLEIKNVYKRKSSGKLFFYRLIIGFLFLIIVFNVAVYFLRLYDFSFLLNGLGISGSADYSISERLNGLIDCLEIFMKNPFMGYSLGGVDPILASYQGITYIDNGIPRSVLGDIILSGGIFGSVIFFIYLGKLIFGRAGKEYVEVRAMKWALLFEFLILCMNANILRICFWMHIAILSVAINRAKESEIYYDK